MPNRIENTTNIQGYAVYKPYADEIAEYLSADFSYGWIDRDGSYIRPFLAKPSSDPSKHTYDVIVVEVEADGLMIKAWLHDRRPKIETLTANYKSLLDEWLEKTNEKWINYDK